MTERTDAAARTDFEQRLYQRQAGAIEGERVPTLPAPDGLFATGAVGHIRLDWEPVAGAAGYVIERSALSERIGEILDHGGTDVPAIRATSFADTGVADGAEYRYRVAAVAGAEHPAGPWSAPVLARTRDDVTGPGITEPGITEPGITEPGITGPGITGPGITGPGITQPGTTQPGTTQPGVTGPGVTGPGVTELIDVRVDASRVTGELHRIWRMIGSERLSQLLLDDDEFAGNGRNDNGPDGNRPDDNGPDDNGPDDNEHDDNEHGGEHRIAEEFAEALRRAHDDLGVTHVRAHAILHDDNLVAHCEPNGRLRFDFTRVDAIYDKLRALGLRPVVELSFMPAALARDPAQTVFTYRGIISPPADWVKWRELVTALARHLVTRYGIDEIAQWAFEVWNEPNLAVFWTGTREEYMRLYDESARALKAVDERLRVGGPSTAAGEWVGALAAHTVRAGSPLDFVSTHTYGNLPLDLRPALAGNGIEVGGADGVPVWWTEWGVGYTHFGPIHDRVFGAPFMLSGYAQGQEHLDALAYWVVSDHFEELGRPPRLFHNGFGLLTVGNLAKPRYWAAHLAAHQGDHVLQSNVAGDGADVLVQAWATMHTGNRHTGNRHTGNRHTGNRPAGNRLAPEGTIDVLLWNGTVNAALIDGDTRLDRVVHVTIGGLDAAAYRVTIARIDEFHSNIAAHCPPDVIWPDSAQWRALRARNRLFEEDLPDAAPGGDFTAGFAVELPMPGVVRLRLIPRTSIDEENR